jgi:hypothetical protein
MPRASISIATAVNPGFFLKVLTACRVSFQKSSIHWTEIALRRGSMRHPPVRLRKHSTNQFHKKLLLRIQRLGERLGPAQMPICSGLGFAARKRTDIKGTNSVWFARLKIKNPLLLKEGIF